ncbi:MAG: HAMP domain-containing histidine kinase [Lachnospiraceae bacterium]|nr:HAMP domain-containing histidine kinase [Lachnospiraceae bacterium]
MQKRNLKWFFIKNFLSILFFIYIAQGLLSFLYRQLIFPFLIGLLEMQQITISGSGSLLLLIIQLTLFYLASLLPGGAADYLLGLITNWTSDGLHIRISSPLYQGFQGTLLNLAFFFFLLFLLGLSLVPYLAGAFVYHKIVTCKINELLEEEKERQLDFERKRSLLLSDIAHDIKTPVTTICGYSRALSEDIVSEEKERDYLNAIYEKALRIDELITLLFEYVKLDSEGYSLRKKSEDLAELLRETVAAFYTEFEEKQIDLSIDIPDQPVPYEMDSLQMRRAVTNLLTNALRYGKEQGKVLVRLKDYSIIVADDGRAIDPDFEKRIFEPFSKENSARSTKEGSGLGLSITAKIVQMHGGTLSLNNAFGEGYTKAFLIKLH